MSSETKRDRAQKRQFKGQQENEEVLVVVHQFPIVLRIPLIIVLVMVLVGIVPWSFAFGQGMDWVGYTYLWMALWLAILLFFGIRSWVSWYYTIYLLTTKRIVSVKQVGFFNRSVSDLSLHNVQSANYSQKGLQAILFGYGTVDVQTLSGSGGFKFRYVHHPQEFQQQIMKHVDKHDPNLDKADTSAVS